MMKRIQNRSLSTILIPSLLEAQSDTLRSMRTARFALSRTLAFGMMLPLLTVASSNLTLSPTSEPESKTPSFAPTDSCKRETCNGENVCVADSCIFSTAHSMLDSIAKSFTNDPDATYDTTTSTTFDDLFSCTAGNSEDDLLEVTHFV